MLTAEERSTLRTHPTIATFSAANPTSIGLGLNMGLCVERTLTKCIPLNFLYSCRVNRKLFIIRWIKNTSNSLELRLAGMRWGDTEKTE